MDHQGCPCKPWRSLFEDLQPFAHQRLFEVAETSEIAGRVRQVVDNPLCDWVRHVCEYNEYSARLFLQRDHNVRWSCKNHVRLLSHQILSLNGVVFTINTAPTNVETHVTIFRPTQRLERFHERAQ
jgi:hypothetical protein